MSAQLLQRIHKTLAQLADLSSKPAFILGLSGGPDSVFLFHALLPLHQDKKIRLRCAHINHGWRAQAVDDQIFCEQLCKKHDIPLDAVHGDDWLAKVSKHKKANASRESLAREVRRAAFAHFHTQYKADGVLLAHHQSDQYETFFMRLIRGTSLTGLSAMRPRSDIYLRPLLTITKKEITDWLTSTSTTFCTDATNQSHAHLRNRIRHTVLPAFTTCDERAGTNLSATLTRLQAEEKFLADMTSDLLTAFIDTNGWVKRTQFFNLHPVLRRRLLLCMLIAAKVSFTPSEGLLAEIERFLNREAGGQHVISEGHIVVKQRGMFRIEGEPKAA